MVKWENKPQVTQKLLFLLAFFTVMLILTSCGEKSVPVGQSGDASLMTVTEQISEGKEQQEEALAKIAQEKEQEYQSALELMKQEQYEDAMETFGLLGDYKDAASLYSECRENYMAREYDKAIQMINDWEYAEAIRILDGIKSWDADYSGVASLYDYCEKLEERSQIEEAMFAEDYQLALDLLEAFPDCMERAEFYTWLMYVALFETDTAYESWNENVAYFDHIYPKGSIWVIDSYSVDILKDYWTDQYILKLERDDYNNCILCEGLPDDVLRNVRSGEHFVIVGEFYGFEPDWDYYIDDYGYHDVGAFTFKNCRFLSETRKRDKYAGVFSSEHTLSEVTGAEEYLRRYEEKAETEETEETGSKQTEPEKNEHTTSAATYEVPYYSVKVPEEIGNQISVDLDEVGNSMWFNLKANDDSSTTYYLFGLIICTDRNLSALDQVHPMHDILGDLTTDRGEELYLVAVYPTPNSLYFEDEEIQERYGEFANKIIPQIVESIKGVNGCTYLAWEDNR